jgi:hypothetical protein
MQIIILHVYMSSIKITKFHLYMSSILITKLQLHKSSTRHSYKIANLLSIHIHVTRVSLINHYIGDHTHSTSKYQISSPYTITRVSLINHN